MSEKIAIVNVNSYGRDFPEFITKIEAFGEVKKFMFDQNATPDELVSELDGYTYIILGTHPTFTKEFFEKNNSVRLIARHGLGFNNVDLKAAKEHGVYVTREENVIEQDAVAETAVSLIHAVARCIPVANKMVHDGEWKVNRARLMGYQLRNKTTGIIGYGNIGRRVGEIMKYGYKNKILAYDPYLPVEKAEEYGIELCTLEELLAQSDFISLHCFLTPENEKMINAENIKLMKRSAILINCARGKLVDEEAVAKAVKNRDIFGYGADTTASEPINEDNELLKLDHVILSPHVGVYTLECTHDMNKKVYEDIELVHNGKRPKVIINEM